MTITDLHTLSHRDRLGEFLNEHGLTGIGVEVGVAFGDNARRILSTWKGKTLFLVDLWAAQPHAVYLEDTGGDFEARRTSAFTLAAEDRRASPLQMDSVAAAAVFPEATFDFAYIDANHSDAATTADLAAWWPKVRPGGLFGGHDFYTDIRPPAYVQVQHAVMRWCATHALEYIVTGCTSWWTIKPVATPDFKA